jgi:hypothetical protein
MPILAVNRAEDSFAVAVGSKLRIFKPTSAEAMYNRTFDEGIVGVLCSAGSGRRGYMVLFDDGTVRRAETTSISGRGLLELPSAGQDDVAAEAGAKDEAEDDGQVFGLVGLSSTGAQVSSSRPKGLSLESGEHERPVVRPEELALALDGGAGSSVKSMFEAVVGLFGGLRT